MLSDRFHALSVFDKKRLAIAKQIVERKQHELGDHLRAAACYGSVAHHAASEYSDVEMVLLTDESIPTKEEQFFCPRDHGGMRYAPGFSDVESRTTSHKTLGH